MVKIFKNPGNGGLNNLNDPVLNVLTLWNFGIRFSKYVNTGVS